MDRHHGAQPSRWVVAKDHLLVPFRDHAPTVAIQPLFPASLA